eukprot:10353185-Heterocapsa_arctica.AAC.1
MAAGQSGGTTAAYNCRVYRTREDPSGNLSLAPNLWRVGASASQHQFKFTPCTLHPNGISG